MEPAVSRTPRLLLGPKVSLPMGGLHRQAMGRPKAARLRVYPYGLRQTVM